MPKSALAPAAPPPVGRRVGRPCASVGGAVPPVPPPPRAGLCASLVVARGGGRSVALAGGASALALPLVAPAAPFRPLPWRLSSGPGPPLAPPPAPRARGVPSLVAPPRGIKRCRLRRRGFGGPQAGRLFSPPLDLIPAGGPLRGLSCVSAGRAAAGPQRPTAALLLRFGALVGSPLSPRPLPAGERERGSEEHG